MSTKGTIRIEGTTMKLTEQIRRVLTEANDLIELNVPLSRRDEAFEADLAAFQGHKHDVLEQLRIADRAYVSTELTQAQAEGLACVVCSHEFADRDAVSRPVGRVRHAGQVFACVGDCWAQATA